MSWRIVMVVAPSALLAVVAAYWFGSLHGVDIGRAGVELEIRRAAEETRERVRDAEISRGDEADDLDYLRCVVLGVCSDGSN